MSDNRYVVTKNFKKIYQICFPTFSSKKSYKPRTNEPISNKFSVIIIVQIILLPAEKKKKYDVTENLKKIHKIFQKCWFLYDPCRQTVLQLDSI